MEVRLDGDRTIVVTRKATYPNKEEMTVIPLEPFLITALIRKTSGQLEIRNVPPLCMICPVIFRIS